MPYADAEKQREAVRAWREAHPERVREHRKKSMVKKAAKERRLPGISSIEALRINLCATAGSNRTDLKISPRL